MADSAGNLYRAILMFFATILVLALVYLIKDIIILFILAFLLGYALNPLIDSMEKRRIPRAVAILIMLLILLTAVFFAFYGLVPLLAEQISTLVDAFPDYADTSKEWWNDFTGSYPQLQNQFDPGQILEQSGKHLNTAAQSLVTAISSVFTFIVSIILVLAIAFYGLTNPGAISRTLEELIPPGHQEMARRIANQMFIKIGSFLRGVLLLGLIIGLLSYLGFSFLGLKYALTLAIIAGLLELVPLIGPIIAGTIAVTVALFQEPALAFWVLIFVVAIQQAENHILVPNLMSQQMGLHPVTVIFATLVMTNLMGLTGLFLAVPVAAIIKILIEELYLPYIRSKQANGIG